MRAAPALGGHRIVVSHPDGRRDVHDFADYTARYLGTVAIRVELLRDGWRPVRPPRRRTVAGVPRGQSARAARA